MSEYTTQLNLHIPTQPPVRLTLCGDGNDKIELFYDRENRRWDMTIVGERTTSIDSFKKWILEVLPVCTCMEMKK